MFANTTTYEEYINFDVTLASPATAVDTLTISVDRVTPPWLTHKVPPVDIMGCTIASGSTECANPIQSVCQYSATNGSVYYVTLSTMPDGTVPVHYTFNPVVSSVSYTELVLEKKTTATAVQPTKTVLSKEYMFFAVPVADSLPSAGSRVTFTVTQTALAQFDTSGTYLNYDAIPCSQGTDCSLPVHFDKGCSFASKLTCTIYVDECTVARLGGGTYTLALTVA